MERWALRSKAVLIVGAVLGSLVGIRVQTGVREAADELARLDFSLAAAQRAALVGGALRAPAERLDALLRFIENSDDVTPNDFAGFLYPWIKAEEGLSFSIFDSDGALTRGAMDGRLRPRFRELAKNCDAGVRSSAAVVDADDDNPKLLIVRAIETPKVHNRYAAVVADIGVRIKNSLRNVDAHGLPTSVLYPGGEKPIVRFDDPRKTGAGKTDPLFSYVEAVDAAGLGLEIRVEASDEYLIRRKNKFDFLISPGFAVLFALIAYAAEALLRRGDRAERLRQLAINDLERFFSLDLDLFCVTDADNRFIRINPAWERMFGFSSDELIGTSFLDLIHTDDRANTLEPEALKKKTADRVSRVRKKDGKWRLIEWRSAAVGGRRYTAARDVTEREEYEDRLRKTLAEKETLLREVHHRVKNNMQIISSLLNLQSRDADDSKIAETMESTQGRIRTMAMVHDALYHSLDFSDIDFDEFAANLASACVYGLDRLNFTVNVRKSGIRLGLDLAIPCGLILNELVTNGARYAFADANPTRLEIALREKGDTLELEVADNGKGIDPGFDLDTNPRLGLKLVMSLASQLGGRLERVGGPGTRFRILFKPSRGSYVSGRSNR